MSTALTSRKYALAPRTEPGWRFTPDDFAVRIKRRWPRARVGQSEPPGSPTLWHAIIPAQPAARELHVVLLHPGWAVALDPATPADAVDFTLWYIAQLPSLDPPVYLTAHDVAAEIPLRRDTTAEDLLAVLAPVDVARPDPLLVAASAKTIFDRVRDSAHYRSLTEAIRILPRRWTTLTGLVLVAQLDLATDAEPLIGEVWRLLALRAAVHQLTGSDATAATLVAPAPVDDAARVVLAEHTLCLELAQELEIRLVQRTSEWTPLGWTPGNYTDRCYRAAWGESPDRYWIAAGEERRRLQVLNKLWFEVGIDRDGCRHRIRFEPRPDPWMAAV